METTAITRTDVQLLNVFREFDDHRAFLDIVREHAPWVFSRCKRIVKDRHLAEDAVQEVFLGLAKNAVRIRDGQALRAWLACAAQRISTRLVRAQKRFRHVASVEGQAGQQAGSMNQSTVEQQSLQFWESLEHEIGRLPADDQYLLKRYYFDGQKIDILAQEMNTNFHTVRTRLHRCKAVLRKRLKTSTMLGLAVALEVRSLHGFQALLQHFSAQPGILSTPGWTPWLWFTWYKAFCFAVGIMACAGLIGYGSFLMGQGETPYRSIVMPVIEPRIPYQQRMVESYQNELHQKIVEQLQKLTLGSNLVELIGIESYDTRLALIYRLSPKLPSFVKPRNVAVQFILQASTGYVEIKADLESRNEWRLLQPGQHLKLIRVPEWNWEWTMDLKPLHAVEHLLHSIPGRAESQEEDRLHVEKVRKAMQPFLGSWWDPVHSCKINVRAEADGIRWEQPGYEYTIHLRDFRLVGGEIHLGSNVVEKRFWNEDQPQMEWLLQGQKALCKKNP